MQPHKREILHCSVGGRNHFREWLDALKDIAGVEAINKRLDRVEDGNFGDRRFVGAGVSELRIHFGPGYRVYYGEDGPIVVLLLCGGDKGTQWRDIRRAQELWDAYRRSR